MDHQLNSVFKSSGLSLRSRRKHKLLLALTDFVAPAPEGRNVYSVEEIILQSSVRSDICQSGCRPAGAKSSICSHCYKHFAPPGLANGAITKSVSARTF